MKIRLMIAGLASLALAGPALAQTAAGAAAAQVQPAVAGVRLPAGLVVELETVEPVSSAANQLGDRFAIRVTTPVIVDGVVVIPAGTLGVAEVTSIKPAGMLAKGGELMVLARYLTVGDTPVPLRGMKLGVRGENNLFLAFVAAQAVGPLALFIKGGNVVFPAGTLAQARIAAEMVVVPAPAPPMPEPVAPVAPAL